MAAGGSERGSAGARRAPGAMPRAAEAESAGDGEGATGPCGGLGMGRACGACNGGPGRSGCLRHPLGPCRGDAVEAGAGACRAGGKKHQAEVPLRVEVQPCRWQRWQCASGAGD